MTGINPMGAAPIPKYDGVLPYPTDRALAYEGSPLVKVTGDEFQWVQELTSARGKIETALGALEEIRNEPVPLTRGDASWKLVTGLDDARRAVSPYMNHVPGSDGFAENEVPRYLPDGTMHPDDVAAGRRMNTAGSVQMHQETILHRLPKEHVSKMHWQGVQQSLDTSTAFDDLLVWNGRTRSGLPDVPVAISTLKRLDAEFGSLIQNGGDGATSSGLLGRIAALPTPVKAAGVAGVVLAGAGAGVAIARD